MPSLYNGSENITINADGNITEKNNSENIFGVNVDYKLKFNEHLSRILPYKNFEKNSY